MTSLFDLYKIGIGPSSSHTMGPMRAAFSFAHGLVASNQIDSTARVQAELYGSLAHTGLGHATDRAVLLGLSGNEPSTVDPETITRCVETIRDSHQLVLADAQVIHFDEETDLIFHRNQMFPPGAIMQHPNGIRFSAFDATGAVLSCRTWFSIGGGFITEDGNDSNSSGAGTVDLPYPFHSAADLLTLAHTHSLSIAEIMLANECARIRPQADEASSETVVRCNILNLWKAMQGCVARGIATEGILPGGLNVRRRGERLRWRA